MLSEKQFEDKERLYSCYVFPTKKEYDCEPKIDKDSRNTFSLGGTYSGRVFQILAAEYDTIDGGDIDADEKDNGPCIHIGKEKRGYELTPFYRIECVLKHKAEP